MKPNRIQSTHTDCDPIPSPSENAFPLPCRSGRGRAFLIETGETIIVAIVLVMWMTKAVWEVLTTDEDEDADQGTLLGDIIHNNKLHRKWVREGRPIWAVTIGWRPDPHHHTDGFSFYEMQDGQPVYRRRIR